MAASVAEPYGEASAWYLTARFAEERGDLETAVRAWTWVVRLGPVERAGWEGLAGALEAVGRPGEAIPAWENAGRLSTGADAARAAVGRGRSLLAAGRRSEAVGVLEGAVAQSPDAWRWLAQAVDDAAFPTVFARWTAAEPGAAEAMARGAVAADRDPALAVDAWMPLLGDPQHGADAAAGLLGALRASCRFGTVLMHANAHPPTEPRWKALAAEAARRTGDPRLPDLLDGTERLDALLAAGQFAPLLAEVPNQGDRAGWRAMALAGEGQPAAAERALEGTAEPRVRAAVAGSWLAAGNVERARALLAGVDPADPSVGLVRIRLALEAGDPASARAAAAVVSGWDAAEAVRRLAEVALLLGDVRSGEGWLREAGLAGSVQAWRQLGPILAARGDRPGMQATWEAVLRAEPEDPDAWSALGDPERALRAEPCHVAALRAVAEARGCAGWRALWEVAPRDPALAARRESCPLIPSAPGEER